MHIIEGGFLSDPPRRTVRRTSDFAVPVASAIERSVDLPARPHTDFVGEETGGGETEGDRVIDSFQPHRWALSSPDDTPTSEQQETNQVPASPGNRPTGSDRPDAISGPDLDSQPDEDEYELSIDRIFKLLKNSRRRATLRYLNNHGGEATLSEIAEYIAAVENGTTPRAITSQQRKRVYVGLYQSHLPKMNDAAVVDFEKNRGSLERGPNAAQLEPYLIEPDSRRWDKLYLAIALGAVLALIAAWTSTDPLSSTLAAVGVVILLGLAAVTGAQLVADRR